MGFLKKFFKSVFHESGPRLPTNSFETLSEEQLEAHLGVAHYGDYTLTDAVRPSFDLKVVPTQGYRYDTYRDPENKTAVPVVMASASRERLFEVFMELLSPLGNEVDVVIETSHHRSGGGHVDLYREQIDLPILESTLWEFEDLLTNDGCTGIAVLNPGVPQEVQFDEHKLLIVYGQPLGPFEDILRRHGVKLRHGMKFITEAEHVHSSSEKYGEEFEQLQCRLGIDSEYS
jgi:hypothetical protein